jgi:hypothetical protein
MFKNITINLTHSFCPCPEDKKDWGWGIRVDVGKCDLILVCKNCGTRLEIPEIKAVFNVESPNPSSEKIPEMGRLRLVKNNEEERM